MLAALALILLKPDLPHLVENWHMDLRKGSLPEFQNDQLWIAGKCIDAKTGFAKSPSKLDINAKFGDFNRQVEPEFNINGLAAKRIYQGEDFDLAVAGTRYQSINAFSPSALLKLDSTGNLAGFADGININRPIFHVSPYHVTGNVANGYFRVTSNPIQSEHDVSYESLILLEPFKPSPLPIYLFLDLTQPQRAIGYWHPDFNGYLKSQHWYGVTGQQLACGDIYTGKVHWKLPPSYRWAARVSGKILTYGSQGKWSLYDERTGKFKLVDFEPLKGLIPEYFGVSTIEGQMITMRLHGNERRVTVASYSLQAD
jgi:hypothetical protein